MKSYLSLFVSVVLVVFEKKKTTLTTLDNVAIQPEKNATVDLVIFEKKKTTLTTLDNIAIHQEKSCLCCPCCL